MYNISCVCYQNWYEILMNQYNMHTRYMIIYVGYMISNVYDILNYPVGLNCALYIRWYMKEILRKIR